MLINLWDTSAARHVSTRLRTACLPLTTDRLPLSSSIVNFQITHPAVRQLFTTSRCAVCYNRAAALCSVRTISGNIMRRML